MGIRKRNNGFQVYIYDSHTRKQITETLPTLAQAKKREASIRNELQSGNYQKKSPRNNTGGTTFNSKGLYHENHNYLSIQNVIQLYLKKNEFASSTLKKKIYMFRYILTGYENITIQELADNANIILSNLFDKHILSQKTKKNYVCLIEALLNWCVQNSILQEYTKLPKIKNVVSKHFIPPTQEELSAMIQASSPHFQRIIIIGSQLGVRIGKSEMFKMQWKDVDWNRHCVLIHAALKNKNEPFRELPLSDVMYSIFKKWYSEDKEKGFTHIINFYGRAINVISIVAWKKMLSRAGITRRIRPYDLRHSFATEAIAAGADPGTVAKLMGHANIDMIFKHYQHVMNKQKQAVMDNLANSSLCQNCVKTLCQENEGKILQ